ncbi:MAG: MFS transporter [Sphingopyxis sp.]|nr:MFS transporter [Sphingopyxis sp.]
MLDRTVISLLVEPIKADLGLSDTGIALLQGATFAIFYALTGVPIGWLADRKNRRNIVAGGIGLWSFMTIVCGLATSFATLFIARTGVAIGEAALNPAAYSMLSDRFSRAKLGRAIGIFTAAGVVGTGLALLIGGMIYSHFAAQGGWEFGWKLKPWQATFVAVGIPGLILALLVLLCISEPQRLGQISLRSDMSAESRAVGVFAFVKSNRAVYGPLLFGYGILCIVGYAFVSWGPASLGRVHGLSPSEVGGRFGMLMLVFGSLGPLFSGLACDRLIKSGRSNGPMICLLSAAALCFFSAVCLFFSGDLIATWISYGGIALGFTAMLASVPIAIQLLTPSEFRARVAALGLVSANVIGLGIGPLLVGLLNDHIFTGVRGIATSLPIVLAASAMVGFLVVWPARHANVSAAAGGSPTL